MQTMSRLQAAQQGLGKYYTGKACGRGHDGERYTSTGTCVECAKGHSNDYSKKVKVATNARAAGQFVYPCHPDDIPAALAYCQALDAQRGRPPFVPAIQTLVKPLDIDEMRRRIFGQGV